ncbi:MAG TPA: abortive infection family protein [Lacipirellulaceae bacterium]|nr:abortive infection family protein [Lacipirellulaceae bacterium]
MASPLIGKKAVNELQEYFVSTTLRKIEMDFDAAGIARDDQYQPNVSGQRRALVQQYLKTLDLNKPRDARRLLRVFEGVLAELDVARQNREAYDQKEAERVFVLLCRLLKHDGYRYEDGHIIAERQVRGLEDLQHAVGPLDLPHLLQQIDRMRDAADDDPWLAIGTAKELVETVCKTILRERSVEPSGRPEMPELLKLTRDSLRLLPEHIDGGAKAADTIKRLLSNLGTIAQNLAELRRDYGTGHGHDGRARGLEPRHARLAVNAAVTLATFLVETHQARSAAPSDLAGTRRVALDHS